MQISMAQYVYCLRCAVLSETQPVLQTEQSQKTFWTKKKKLAVVLAVILIVAVVLLLLLGFRPTNQVSSSIVNCTNGANNYPRCDSCPSGKTLASNNCVSNCTISATNPPSCTAFNPCTNGATNPPGCNVFNPCVNGATNPPACTMLLPCTNGATNPPACNTLPACTNGATNPPSCTIYNPCSNGATNPPTCTTFPNCSNGATNPPTCSEFPPCSNGAMNPPACNEFPPCSNGATNPPTCTVMPACTNGATNYPACTVFSTTTSLVCNPTSIIAQQLSSTVCTVTVTSTVAAAPTGIVSFTGSSAWYNSGSSCVLIPNSGGYSSACKITGVSVKDNVGDLVLGGVYAGDASHLTSSGQTNVTVTNPSDNHCNSHDKHELREHESHEDRDCHFRSHRHDNDRVRDLDDRSDESENE